MLRSRIYFVVQGKLLDDFNEGIDMNRFVFQINVFGSYEEGELEEKGI